METNRSGLPVAAAILVLAMLLVAILAWSGIGQNGQPDEIAEPPSVDEPGDPGTGPNRLGSADVVRTPSVDQGGQNAPRVRPPAAAAHGTGLVALRAVRHDDDRPIPDFRWTFVERVGDVPAEGAAENGVAWLAVPLESNAAVRVEAEGFARSLAVDVSLLGGATTREVEARLVPVVTGTALVLHVTDEQGRPVERLRVTCEEWAGDGVGAGSWRTTWRRESLAEGGVHRIEAIDPGRSRLRLVALQEDGRPALLVPVTEVLRFAAVEDVRAEIALAAGGSVVVVPGEDFRPGTGTYASAIALLDRSGAVRRNAWQTVDGQPADVAFDTLPAREPCELAEPVLPGTYTVRLRSGSREENVAVTVHAGQRTTVELP